MTRRWLRIISFAALAPLAVDMPGDSSSTSLTIGVGAGSYAAITRGCDGSTITRRQEYFRDVGAAVEHKTSGPLSFGVRSAVLRRMPGYDTDAVLVNPYVAIDKRYFGIGVGFISGVDRDDEEDYDIWPVSGHLRVGSQRGPLRFSIHALEDVPLASGGGAIRLGFGFRPVRALDAWVGLGTPIPYDHAGLVVKTDIHIHRRLDLNFAGRLGGSEGLDENAAALGITYRFPHGRGTGTE